VQRSERNRPQSVAGEPAVRMTRRVPCIAVDLCLMALRVPAAAAVPALPLSRCYPVRSKQRARSCKACRTSCNKTCLQPCRPFRTSLQDRRDLCSALARRQDDHPAQTRLSQILECRMAPCSAAVSAPGQVQHCHRGVTRAALHSLKPTPFGA
jgi:hypothetical protein